MLPFRTDLHSVLSLSDMYSGFPVSPRSASASASSRLIAGDILLPAIHSPDVKQTCILHSYWGRETLQVSLLGKEQKNTTARNSETFAAAINWLQLHTQRYKTCTPHYKITNTLNTLHEVLAAAAKLWVRPLFVYPAPNISVLFCIGDLNLWPRQWHQNRFKLLSICLQSQCNAIITCFHGPGHIWLALLKKEKKITQGAFFLSSLSVFYFSIWLIFLK